ncbi:tetratricopeptide repeat protein [soil metagenome]
MARTTRICSVALLLAVLGPVQAHAKRSEPSALGLYARARIGGGTDAARAYSDALTAAPQEATVAFHAFRQAIVSGDYALALRAAQSLERANLVPPEARLLFYIAALRDRDWNAASVQLQAITNEPNFAFMVPILADWLALGSGEPALLSATKVRNPVDSYGQESRALMMLARGDISGGSIFVRTLWPLDPYRAQSLRLTAAATLADRGERDAAVALLIAGDASTTAARALIAKGRKLRFATNTPASGTAFLLSRMAGDLVTEGAGRAATTLARLAQFADPENPRIALIAAGAFAAGKDPTKANRQIALALANRLRGDPVYGSDAASLRIDLLETLGDTDQAVAEARARAGSSVDDLARVGDIEARRGNFAQAAAIFRQILDGTPPNEITAALLFATGNALYRSGDWTAARPYLERALTLAPGNPVLLNELGYGLIEHGEDTARAVKFLTMAGQMKPDSAAIMDSMGWANFRLGANDQAIAELERAVALDNAEPEIGEHLGDAYWRGGRRIEARYSWTAARVQADGVMAVRLDSKIDRGLP